MKPPRTLFSLGRPGAKPAGPTLAPEAAEDAGTDTVVETVEPPVDEVQVAHEAEAEAEAPADVPAVPDVPDVPAVDDVTVIDEHAASDTELPATDLPAADLPSADQLGDTAAIEPAIESAIEPVSEPELVSEPEPEPVGTDDSQDSQDSQGSYDSYDSYDASAEESGYLCGACDAPLPVGATICAACGTPVAGAELYEDAATPPGDADVVAEAFVAGAALDDRATLVPDAPAAPEAEQPFAPAAPEVAAPAAVLYGDSVGVEPLPPTPEGTWGITQPSFGGVGDDIDARGAEAGDTLAPTDPAVAETAAAWADPGAAAAAGIAATAGLAAGVATAANQTDPALTAGAPPAAPTSSAYAGSDASSMPYGTGAVTSSEPSGSKAPLWIAAAVVVVLIGLIGGIVVAMNGKSDSNGQASPPVTTAKAAVTSAPTTTAKPSNASTPSTAAPTTAAPSTASTPTTAAPTSTDAPTTVATTASTIVTTQTTAAPVVTTAPRQTTIITSPPTTAPVITPGSISASTSPGLVGGRLEISKGGQGRLILTNTGGRPASCAISVEPGSSGVSPLSLSGGCSPSIAPGSSVTITITPNPGYEGDAAVGGLLEGVGQYRLPIFVKNG